MNFRMGAHATYVSLRFMSRDSRYADVWRLTPDAKTLCALLLYERLYGRSGAAAGAVV